MILFLLLLLSDAPPQTTLPLPVRPPQTTLAVPEPLRQPKALPEDQYLTLKQAAALAERLKRPLILWVGRYDDAVLRTQLNTGINYRVETWNKSAISGIVPTIVRGGWIYERSADSLIPAKEADAAKVKQALELLRKEMDIPTRQQRSEATVFRGAVGRSC